MSADGLMANLSYLNQSRKLSGYLYPAIEILRAKLEAIQTVLSQIDTLADEVKKHLTEFLAIRPAPSMEPSKVTKEKEKMRRLQRDAGE